MTTRDRFLTPWISGPTPPIGMEGAIELNRLEYIILQTHDHLLNEILFFYYLLLDVISCTSIRELQQHANPLTAF